jgi:hypothetical protein
MRFESSLSPGRVESGFWDGSGLLNTNATSWKWVTPNSTVELSGTCAKWYEYTSCAVATLSDSSRRYTRTAPLVPVCIQFSGEGGK